MKVSTDYQPVSFAVAREIAPKLQDGWKNSTIPQSQWKLVSGELERYGAGAIMPHFDMLHTVLRAIPKNGTIPTLLDVGAASGYYREVLRLRGFKCRYTAIDYSTDFMELAKNLFNPIDFHVGDACCLPYASDTFDIVLSSGCILHIIDYPEAIREAARVSKKYVVFHRTPVVQSYRETTYFKKLAYGVPCLEIHFSEEELFGIFGKVGLHLVAEGMILETNHKTYLMEKK